MELTKERKSCLQLISLAGGKMAHDDERLTPFCDDASTLTKPNVFNQCHDAGWLVSSHDDRTDSSTAYLTQDGSDILDAHQ